MEAITRGNVRYELHVWEEERTNKYEYGCASMQYAGEIVETQPGSIARIHHYESRAKLIDAWNSIVTWLNTL